MTQAARHYISLLYIVVRYKCHSSNVNTRTILIKLLASLIRFLKCCPPFQELGRFEVEYERNMFQLSPDY